MVLPPCLCPYRFTLTSTSSNGPPLPDCPNRSSRDGDVSTSTVVLRVRTPTTPICPPGGKRGVWVVQVADRKRLCITRDNRVKGSGRPKVTLTRLPSVSLFYRLSLLLLLPRNEGSRERWGHGDGISQTTTTTGDAGGEGTTQGSGMRDLQ